MPFQRATRVLPIAFVALCLSVAIAPRAAAQVAEPAEKVPPGQPPQHQHHHLHLPMGEEKCEPKFTYTDGPAGPGHWPGLCNTGKMQSPIDIEKSDQLHIYDLKFNYQPADLDIIDDCNDYRILLKFQITTG
jgi:carbonic anhydrase